MGGKEANIRMKKRDEATIAQGDKEVQVKDEGIKKTVAEMKLKPPGLKDWSRIVGWITKEIKLGNTDGIVKAMKTGELDRNFMQKLHRNTVTNGNDEARELIEKAFSAQDTDEDALDKNGERIPEMQKNKDGVFVGGYKKRTLADVFAEATDRETRGASDPNDRTGPAGSRPSGLNRKDVEENKYESFLDKVLANLKTADDIKHLSKGMIDRTEFYEAVNKFWGGSQVSKAAEAFGREFINKLEESKKDATWYFDLEEKKTSNGTAYFTPRNAQMAKYLASNPAQGLGLTPAEGAEDTTTVNKMAKDANEKARIRTASAPKPTIPSAPGGPTQPKNSSTPQSPKKTSGGPTES